MDQNGNVYCTPSLYFHFLGIVASGWSLRGENVRYTTGSVVRIHVVGYMEKLSKKIKEIEHPPADINPGDPSRCESKFS